MTQSIQAKKTGNKKQRRQRMKMPPPIPDTLDNVIDAVLTTPPKKRSEWKYIQEQKGRAHGASGTATG